MNQALYIIGTDCLDIFSQCKLPAGRKVYYSGWDDDGNEKAFEREITGYREHGESFTYLCTGGGFSRNSIGHNVFLSEEQALENVKRKR